VKDRVDKVITCALLCALHTRLITPVEEHLGGAKELLIVPHKELSEVPWAALRNKDRRPVTHRWPLLSSRRRRYLVQDHVIRVAPSLDVARKAAENMPPAQSEHALVVGNPTRDLSCAERESRNVQQTLTRAGVRKVDYYERGEATKARVKESLLGLSDGSVCIWAHLACHGDVVAHSLKLAPGDGPSPENGDLSMEEVQGTGVRLGKGSTVVLSACNSGRGEIKAEGVVGLARSFLWAGAAATVVSLWKVNDRRTCDLMDIMYFGVGKKQTGSVADCRGRAHLARELSVPHAMRQAMMEKIRELEHPKHWAGFVVIGARTHLRPTQGGGEGLLSTSGSTPLA